MPEIAFSAQRGEKEHGCAFSPSCKSLRKIRVAQLGAPA